MRRILLVFALVLLLAGCSAGNQAQSVAEEPSNVAVSQTDTSVQPDSSAQPETAVLEDGEVTVTSHSCYSVPYCLRPERDGTYHFSAITADDFVGEDYDYAFDAIYWTIYVLDEEFTDAWRYLAHTQTSAIQDLNGSVDIALKAGQYVYCVPSLNGFTGNEGPENAGVLTISPVETDFLPNAHNNYQLPITLNSETRFDLDGDGSEERVCYSVIPAALNGNVWSAAQPSLTINGEEHLDLYLDNLIYMEDPEVTSYYIVDLNKGDSYREVAITDWGYNDLLVTHYFRYDQGNVTYLGTIPGFPGDHTTVFYGDGRVEARTQLEVLQTWFAPMLYQLQGDAIIRPEGQLTQPDCEGMSVTLLRDIVVYTEPDLNSPTLILAANTAPLTFGYTDGKHWVELFTADGGYGWAYFSDFATLVSGEEQILVWEGVFDGLFMAG